MAFIKPVVKLILREYEHYRYRGPVLALGVPEIYPTAAELQTWSAQWLGKTFPEPNGPGMLSDNEAGKKLGWVSARYFFAGLDLGEVTYMDIPGSEHTPDLVHDLNTPLPADRLNRYGVVFDPGTIEHVFDMRTCLANVVHALQIGGVVIHQVPVYMFNGGYYSINPNLLNDFYSKNGFSDCRTYIVMWDRYHPYTGECRCYEYTPDVMGGRHALSDFDQCRYAPLMLFFARKQEAKPTIEAPIQYEGHYHAVAGGGGEAAPAKPRGLGGRARLLLRQGIAALPEAAADELNGQLNRLGMLRRTRKHSFWM